jgi:AraC-like DNA-binding protein
MRHFIAKPRSPALAPFIASFHYHESEFAPMIERIIPTGQAHIMVNLEEDEFRTYSGDACERVQRMRGAVLSGPHGQCTAIDTREQRHLVAVEFKLGGAAAFLEMPMSEVRDQMIELGDIWNVGGDLLREKLCEAPTPVQKFRVLEKTLLEHLVSAGNPGVAAAVSMLGRGVSVSDARSRLGLLPKTFVRRLREQVGLTPKRLFRVRRLHRILSKVRGPAEVDWCALAADYGYTDQAHFIHDFRDLTGLTPSEYRPASAQRRNHIPIAKLAV